MKKCIIGLSSLEHKCTILKRVRRKGRRNYVGYEFFQDASGAGRTVRIYLVRFCVALTICSMGHVRLIDIRLQLSRCRTVEGGPFNEEALLLHHSPVHNHPEFFLDDRDSFQQVSSEARGYSGLIVSHSLSFFMAKSTHSHWHTMSFDASLLVADQVDVRPEQPHRVVTATVPVLCHIRT